MTEDILLALVKISSKLFEIDYNVNRECFILIVTSVEFGPPGNGRVDSSFCTGPRSAPGPDAIIWFFFWRHHLAVAIFGGENVGQNSVRFVFLLGQTKKQLEINVGRAIAVKLEGCVIVVVNVEFYFDRLFVGSRRSPGNQKQSIAHFLHVG